VIDGKFELLIVVCKKKLVNVMIERKEENEFGGNRACLSAFDGALLSLRNQSSDRVQLCGLRTIVVKWEVGSWPTGVAKGPSIVPTKLFLRLQTYLRSADRCAA